MAATLVIRSFHGTTGATTNDIDNTTARFKASDDDVVDTNSPLIIPGSGSVYSYLKQFKLRITATAPSNLVNNIKFFTDGANGMPANGSPAGSVKVWVKTSNAYVNPVANAQTQVATMTDAFTYTSVTPLALGGSGSVANTDIQTDYLLLQLEVTSAALQGTSNAETVTIQYDES